MSLIDDARAGMSSPVPPPLAGPPPMPAPAFPTPPPAVSPRCYFCGSMPTAHVTMRGHIGMIFLMRRLKHEGAFCRDCGMAVFRRMTARTLVTGWWGYASFVMTPYVIISNLVNRRKVTRLAAPQSPAPGREPIPVGRPVWQRWQIVGALVPVAIIALIIGSVTSGSGSASPSAAFTDKVGECVQTVGATEMRVVACDQTHDGKVTAIVSDDTECAPDTTWTLITPDHKTLCVATSFE